jgi:hypothetical protein
MQRSIVKCNLNQYKNLLLNTLLLNDKGLVLPYN